MPIAHLDLDAFFVSVECLLEPSLKGKPLIVGGNSDRGVVAACSYEARKFGIHSAMPISTAKRLCPQATIIPGTRGQYSKYSRIVTEIISSRVPLMEKASIDEFYVDLRGMDRFFKPFEYIKQLREDIIRETGLPISFGMASNKMVAKIATDEAKPNGYLQVASGMEQAFLAPMKVNKIPGVGEQTYKSLLEMNINTIGDLSMQPVALLEKKFGKWGAELHKKSLGQHDGEVIPYHEAKSISSESTYEKDLIDETQMLSEIVRLTEKIGYELRQENKLAGVIAVKIRYPDFETTSRQASITYTCYDDELIVQAKELFHKLYRKGMPVRLLGVRLSELTNEAIQTNLFDNIGRKTELYKAIDEVKNRFGKNSIRKARK